MPDGAVRVEYDAATGEYILFLYDREVFKSTSAIEVRQRQRLVEAANSY